MASFTKVSGESPSGGSDLPQTSLMIRDKQAITLFTGPVVQEPESASPSFSMTSARLPCTAALRIPPVYSKSGNLVCMVPEREKPSVYDANSLQKLVELDITNAVKAEFSGHGRYIVTWSMPSKTNTEPIGNLKVWNVSSGDLVAHYNQKTYRSDLIQWLSDDSICFRQVANEVHVYNSSNSLAPNETIAKLHHVGFTQYKVAKVEGEERVNIALFNPESSGKPSRVTLYSFNISSLTFGEPLNSRTIFGATEAILMWNKSGLSLLIHSQSDVDSSNSSYYGAMGLYLMHSKSDLSVKVAQTKEGPVHAASWSPNGDRFAIAAGNMPCQCTLYDEKGDPVYQFGAAHRNVISWSPHGRFLCIAGFGNLAGEMDFYDTLRLKKLGSNMSHCATTYQWSPDSRYFMTASLAPRMNVDNCFKLFKYNGIGPILQENFEKAFDAFWRPIDPNPYPNRGPSPLRRTPDGEINPTVNQKAAIPAAQPYRPPHSTGALSNFMKESSSAPVGKVKKETTENKFVPTAQKQRIIPGMPPPQANQGKKKGGNPATSSAPVAKPAPTPAAPAKPVATPTPAAAPVPSAPATVETSESKEKRAKAISKKLKQIEEIRAKISSGATVEPEQMKKLETEASLRRELESLR